MNITDKIQTLRKEKGWSVSKLAKECDIPTISLRVMLSRDDPNRYTVKNLKKIADALGVTVSYLTLEDGEVQSPTITSTQRDEIKTIIAAAIDNYFKITPKMSPKAQTDETQEEEPPSIHEADDDDNIMPYNEGEELED
jgi:transcriptional regulator with XRE-family HTH domain